MGNNTNYKLYTISKLYTKLKLLQTPTAKSLAQNMCKQKKKTTVSLVPYSYVTKSTPNFNS